jgi:ankyrin repeat protein
VDETCEENEDLQEDRRHSHLFFGFPIRAGLLMDLNAIFYNNIARVKQIIALGEYDPDNDQDGIGQTSLHCAAEHGRYECIIALVEAKADVNLCTMSGTSPLHSASWKGFSDCVALLVSFKACINARYYTGETPLHYAAKRGRLACAKQLVLLGAEVDAHEERGNTPLAHAIMDDRRQCAEYLLEAGAKVSNFKDLKHPRWFKAMTAKRRNTIASICWDNEQKVRNSGAAYWKQIAKGFSEDYFQYCLGNTI